MSIFTTDFFLGHLILFVLFPFTLIPSIDRMHSMILFWLRPSKQIRPSVLPTKERKRRRKISYMYGPLFVLILAWFIALIIVPLKLEHYLPTIYAHAYIHTRTHAHTQIIPDSVNVFVKFEERDRLIVQNLYIT